MRAKRKNSPPKPKDAKSGFRGRWAICLAAILVATFAVYTPSLDNGFTNWDDPMYVSANKLIVNPDFMTILTTSIGGNYHPLTVWSLALNYKISGLAPASYHWLNLLLHLANTALVFFFVRRLSGGRFWTTVATSLFFGIHPMHVESVAWIAERKDVLYSFFFLLGLLAYLRHQTARGWVWLLASWIAFMLSMAAKPAAIVFPLALVAIDWFRRRPLTRSVVLEKLPFFAVSLAGGLLTLAAQKAVGAVARTPAWDLWERFLFAAYGTAMYIAKFFVPVHLSAIYPLPLDTQRPLGPEFLLALAAVLTLVGAVVVFRRRLRPVVFGLGFFFINIVLVLQFLTFGGAIMADRYTYLPYIGLLLALAWWLDEDGESIARAARFAVAGCLLLLLPFSLIQTWRRCEVWRDSGTLWDDTIRKSPNPIADTYIHRAYYYHHDVGQLENAVADYDRALAITPGDAHVWSDRGLAFLELNREDSALVSLERAIKLDPKIAQAQNSLGVVRLRQGNPAGAVLQFTRASELDPKYRDAYSNRALAYNALGELEKAMEDYRRAIEVDPGNPGNHVHLDAIGVNLQKLNRYREAMAMHDEAIRLAPPTAPQLGGYLLNRSLAWWGLGDRAHAIQDVEAAERAGAKIPPGYLAMLKR